MKLTCNMPTSTPERLAEMRPVSIGKWSDLPQSGDTNSLYEVGGKTANLSGRERAMLEGLMRRPIRSSSAARLSIAVQGLRRKFGIGAIETIRESTIASDGERSRPGFYRLTVPAAELLA